MTLVEMILVEVLTLKIQVLKVEIYQQLKSLKYEKLIDVYSNQEK
jgi:hypothetical protein